MEKKVKIELPKKYVVGIEVMVPIKSKEMMEVCRNMITAISNLFDNEKSPKDFYKMFSNGGRVVVSNPLIRSIAEMKMEGINNAFNAYCVPFKAFVEKEDEV